MTDRPQISRRRLIVGTGAGAAAMWAAPAVTTLSTAHAAGSNCTVFRFVTEELSPAPANNYAANTALTGTFYAPVDALTVALGNVDLVGPGTVWDGGGYTPTLAMDLTGTAPTNSTTTTELTGPTFGSGTYVVELEVYGALGGGTNTVEVFLGATPLIPTTFGPFGPGSFVTYTSLATVADGTLLLRHVSSDSDQQGLFLKRLELTLSDCGSPGGPALPGPKV